VEKSCGFTALFFSHHLRLMIGISPIAMRPTGFGRGRGELDRVVVDLARGPAELV
jgi:hypothetical protein